MAEKMICQENFPIHYFRQNKRILSTKRNSSRKQSMAFFFHSSLLNHKSIIFVLILEKERKNTTINPLSTLSPHGATQKNRYGIFERKLYLSNFPLFIYRTEFYEKRAFILCIHCLYDFFILIIQFALNLVHFMQEAFDLEFFMTNNPIQLLVGNLSV